MTNIYKDFDVRMFRMGLVCARAASAPALGATDLFSITGGNILVTGFIGEVTTVLDANASTFKMHFDPDEATATHADLSIATGAQNAAPVGRHYHLPASAASALDSDDGALSGFAEHIAYRLFPPGDIQLVVGGAGQVTGRVKWDLYYIPLDVGSTVVAVLWN